MDNKSIMHIKELLPDKRNARKHNPRNIGMIEKSLGEVGAARSIVIDEENNILAGNGTIEAAAQAGLENVQVVEADGNTIIAVRRRGLTPEQKTKLALYDNRTAELAEWDEVNLEAISNEIDLSALFTSGELDSAMNSPNPSHDEPEIAPLPEISKTMRGDLYEFGGHRLLCGDSTDSADVERLMNGKLADLVFTDPPYGVDYGAKTQFLISINKGGQNTDHIHADNLPEGELQGVLLKCFLLVKKIMSDHCSMFVCAPRGGHETAGVLHQAGLPVRHSLVWVKNKPSFSANRLDYDYQHEIILFTWGKKHKRYNAGEFQTTVWAVDSPRANVEHPTMKPVALPLNAIMNHTDKGDIVYDPFAGSGSTLIAANSAGRKGFSMEIEPKYCDVIVGRYLQMSGGDSVLLNGAETKWDVKHSIHQ